MVATLRTEWRQYRAPSTVTSSTCLSFAQPVRHAISVALDTTDDVRPGGATGPRWTPPDGSGRGGFRTQTTTFHGRVRRLEIQEGVAEV